MFKFFDPNSECFAKYDAICSHVFIVRAEGVRLIAMEEIRYYGKIAFIKNIFENGWWEDAYSSSYPPGHELQKPSKESAYFSHLAPLILFFFTKRPSQKGEGAWYNDPLNTLLSLRLGL